MESFFAIQIVSVLLIILNLYRTVCAITYRQLLYCGSIVTSDYSMSVVAVCDFEHDVSMSIQ